MISAVKLKVNKEEHMKLDRTLVKLGLAAVVASTGAAAFAQQAGSRQPHWYAGGHVGQNDLDHYDANVNFGGPVTTPGSLRLDKGLHFGLQVGRRTEKARFEVEYQHGRSNVEGVTLAAFSQAAGGRVRYNAFTFNAYRMFEINRQIEAFIGAGIGYGSVTLPTVGPIAGCNCFPGTSDNGFVWQLRLGADYEIRPMHTLTLQYTWLHLPSVSSGGTPGVNYSSKTLGAWGIGYRAGF